jgi:hypothetical protein
MNATTVKSGSFWRATAARVLLVLLFVAGHMAAFATDKAPKSYPEKGKVVAASVSEHTDYVPVAPADSKGRTSGGQAFVHRNWVYRVETDDGIYELRGGKKQSMAVGDGVEFRVAKDTAYVLANDKETKYRILSTAPKPTK